MLKLRDKVEEYKMQGKTSFAEQEYEETKEQYLKLLDKWDEEFNKEYTKERSQYYDTERCLKPRLREYADDHLRFLTDFRIDFTNQKVDINYTDFNDVKQTKTSDISPKIKLTEPPVELLKAGSITLISLGVLAVGLFICQRFRVYLATFFSNSIKTI